MRWTARAAAPWAKHIEKERAGDMNIDKIEFEDTVNPSAEEGAEPSAQESGMKDDKKEKKSEIKKLKAELEDTRKKLEESAKQAEEINDKYLRVVAEYDNFRKRSQAERKNVYGDAVAETLAGLLPIIDNLQYAAKYSDGDAEKMVEGLKLILGKMPETLEKMNIRAFGEAGEKFDPNLHNAVLHVEDDTLEEGVIVDVLQCGYLYGDKVIRYAMVKTAN